MEIKILRRNSGNSTVDIARCAAFTKIKMLYEWLWKFRERRLLLFKPYDSVRFDILTKNVLYLLSSVGFLHFNKMEGVGFEPTQPERAADLQSAPINHSGTPP